MADSQKEVLDTLSESELNERLRTVEADLTAVKKSIAKLDATFARLHKKQAQLQDELVRREVARQAPGVVPWATLLEESSGHESYQEFKHQVMALSKVPGKPHSILKPAGYYPANGQHAVELQFKRSALSEVDVAHHALSVLKPYMRPINNRLLVGIFEATLSEHGTYKLLLDPASDLTEVQFTRYGQSKVEATFPTLREGLEYVQQHHPYET